MSEKTLTRMELSEAVFRAVGLSRNESAELVERVLGHMSDALRCVVEYAVATLGLHRLEAACIPSNEASRRLLLRCGFEQEGRARQYLKINGEWHDHLLFAMVLGEPAVATAPPPRLRTRRRA